MPTHRQGTYLYIKDGRKRLIGLGRPIVTVVQPAQSIIGKHPTRGYAASSASRRSLGQSKVRAVLVMVGDVLGKEPLQVPLVADEAPSSPAVVCDVNESNGPTVLNIVAES